MDCTICFGVKNISKLEWKAIFLAIALPALPDLTRGHIVIQVIYCSKSTSELSKQKILKGKQSHNV